MKRNILISCTLFFVLCLTSITVMGAEVNIPFDYYSSGMPAYASAKNEEVTVLAGRLGLIQTVTKDKNIQDIKNLGYEDIYWLEWTGNEFIAFSDNYKLMSEDGYNWTKEVDIDNAEHEKYGVKKPLKSIGLLTMNKTFETDRYKYLNDDGKDVLVQIYNTRKNYIKHESIYRGGGDLGYDTDIYVSSDRENWEYVRTSYKGRSTNIYNPDFCSAINDKVTRLEVMNTGKEYLRRVTDYDIHKNDHNQIHPVSVYDSNFNFVKQIDISEYIVDMSYVDDIYYVTTEDGVTYKSADLENWEVVGENLGVPITNGINTIYKTRTSILAKIYTSDHAYAYEGPILYEDGIPTKNVVEEDIIPFGMRAYGDFFVCFTNGNATDKYTDYSQVKGLDGKPLAVKRSNLGETSVSFSKDGIYWSTIKLPMPTTYALTGLMNGFSSEVQSISCTEDALLIDTGGFGVLFSVKFSDMEQAVPKCDTKVELNNRVLGFSQPPVIENDRTLVPMRFLFEQMGADVNWDDATQTATATVSVNSDVQMRTFSDEPEKSVTFRIDDTTATVNGETAAMDVPARLVNDQTFVPLRFLSENLGYNVEWDENTNTAIITTE